MHSSNPVNQMPRFLFGPRGGERQQFIFSCSWIILVAPAQLTLKDFTVRAGPWTFAGFINPALVGYMSHHYIELMTSLIWCLPFPVLS